jgi:uncharacterized protein
MISVEVVYATGKFVELIPLTVEQGTTVIEAICQSGIMQIHPELNCHYGNIGIYSRLCTEDTVLKDRDRIEIYRPLIADPKEARRMRASRQKSQSK